MKYVRTLLGLCAALQAGCGGADFTPEGDARLEGELSSAVQAGSVISGISVSLPPGLCARAPGIAVQPRDTTARVGRTATFTVTSTCPAGTSYQWFVNGLAIGGGTGPSFTTRPTALDNDGDRIEVELRANPSLAGSGSAARSRVAILRVYAANSGACSAGNRLAGGGAHSLALRADGRVFAWGANGFGQVGNGAGGSGAPAQLAPVLVGAISDVASVSSFASSHASFALERSRGRTWGWGFNMSGQLGDGSYTHRSAPVLVSSLTDAVSVATGDAHTLAAIGDGSTKAWGSNTFSKLGDGTLISSAWPVTALVTNTRCVAASLFHSLALKTDGSVWGWGENGWGQLGSGAASLPPNSVVAAPVRTLLPTEAIALATARDDSLALTRRGQVYAWGHTYGATPRLLGLPTDVVAIAAGQAHYLALLGDGRVFAWGANNAGQVGNGLTSATQPVAVPVIAPLPASIVAIGAGHSHSLALAADGSVWAWGENSGGQLGDGTTIDRPAPVRVGVAPTWLNLN